MQGMFLERESEIRGLLVGLLARQHVLLLGPPGTAKSEMTEELCSRIGGFYFRWLLARTSTPEELFGPISLKGLEQDSYRRVTAGKLPEATIAFIDEIFKCNSAVLNSMLTVLNERLFFNDGQPLRVPLQMAVGASNELPESQEELGALWDRFMLRYIVSYIKNPQNMERLLMLSRNGQPRTTLTESELEQAQAEAAAVDVAAIIPYLIEFRGKISGLNIAVSDRRWRQCLSIIRANAYLNGRSSATEDDLDILVPALWQEPNQVLQIKQKLLEMCNPYLLQAREIQDAAMEIWQAAVNAPDEESTKVGTEAVAKLKKIGRELEMIRSEAQAKGKDIFLIDKILAQVAEWHKEVISKCLGI
jgi:MoxR-like ATPase